MEDINRTQVSPSDEEKYRALLDRITTSVANATEKMPDLDNLAQLAQQGLIGDFRQFFQNFNQQHGRAPTTEDVVRFFEQHPEKHKLVVDTVLLLRGEVDSSTPDDINGRFSFAELISIVQEAKTGFRPPGAFRISRPRRRRRNRSRPRNQGRGNGGRGVGGGGNNDQQQAARRAAAQVQWDRDPLNHFLNLLKNLISKNGDNFFSRRLGPPLQHSVIEVCDMIMYLDNLSGPPKAIWEGYLQGVGAQAVANANADAGNPNADAANDNVDDAADDDSEREAVALNRDGLVLRDVDGAILANQNQVPVAAAAAPAVDHRAVALASVVEKKDIAKQNLSILDESKSQGQEDVYYKGQKRIILTKLRSSLNQDVRNLDWHSQGYYRYNTDAKKDHVKREFLKELAEDLQSLNIAP